MKILYHTCLLLLLLASLTNVEAKVSLENVKQFFNLTYDQNEDEQVTWKEFCDYFKLIEPEHDFAFHILNSAFNSFDINRDGKIILDQFLDFSDIQIGYQPGHKQIHLGFTQNQHQMQVIWVSNPQQYLQPAVIFGTLPTKLNHVQKATTDTYNVGHLGFHGRIYTAVMKNLIPEKKYYYKVGDLKTNTYSEIKHFKAPPSRNSTLNQIRMAVFGDMGTYTPLGHMVTKLIANQQKLKPYDFVFLTGDIAYAGVSSKKVGELQPVWDLYGEQTQSFAAYTAFMPGVGNHESYYNFTSYFARYKLPRNKPNQTNLWFSFDYGQVHMVHLSSEHPYQKGSEQYAFLQEDLKKARENKNIKWIILGTHRAFYCSDQVEYSPISPLTYHLEDLINEYKVDVVMNGHLHAYERMWPVYKGKALKQKQNEKYYVNPESPVYVVQGTAGALIREKWVSPSPEWSMKRFLKYGYGQITIKANYLKYEYLILPVGQVVDSWYIIKDDEGNTKFMEELME